MTVYLRRENARRDKILTEKGVSLQSYSDESKVEDQDKGDDAIFFRFTI